MTEKVIEFPKSKVVRDVPDEQIKERFLKQTEKLADTIVEQLTGIVIEELDNFQVNVEDKKIAKDLVLLVDTLRAIVYRSFGMDHHLHQFIDNNVKLIDGVSKMTKEELSEYIQNIISEVDSEHKE